MLSLRRSSRSATRVLGATIVVALLATGCRVAVDEVAEPPAGAPQERAATSAEDVLPVMGPVPNRSHWHAAYVVRVCDQVLPPLQADADPLGIHSHGDGLIHIHPFFDESGYENARLGLFVDAVGMSLATGELTLPGGGTWRDGDLCDDTPGRVYVDRWPTDDPAGPTERIFDNPQDIRFAADGELYQIAFAPVDAPPVVPPSIERLPAVRPVPQPTPEPFVEIDPDADGSTARLWPVGGVTPEPCAPGQVLERVRVGRPACIEMAGEGFGPADIVAARAVLLNGGAGVELTVSDAVTRFIVDRLRADPDEQVVLALELGGEVVSLARIAGPPTSQDRVILRAGFTEESARALAEKLGG